jgi:hypothetical protein
MFFSTFRRLPLFQATLKTRAAARQFRDSAKLESAAAGSRWDSSFS